MLISMSPCSRRCVRRARERRRTEQFEVRALVGRLYPAARRRRGRPDDARPCRYLISLAPTSTASTARDHTSCNLVPHGPIASQPHRTQHDQRRGFAVEHRDPPIPETGPPKVPRRLATALSPGHAGAIAAITSSSPWDWRGHYGGYGAR